MKNNDMELKILLSKIQKEDLLPRPIRGHLRETNTEGDNDFYELSLNGYRYSVECDINKDETLVYGIIKLPKVKK